MNNELEKLEVCISTFKSEMISINHYKTFENNLIRKLDAYEELLIHNKLIADKKNRKDSEISVAINFLIDNYATGGKASLHHEIFDGSDFLKFQIKLKNRQYQFLLLHAFEAFEKYFKAVNLIIKFDKETINKDGTKIYPKFSPTKFIKNHLYEKIPTITQIISVRHQENNFYSADELIIFFSFIEQLRHQITHASGNAHRKKFIQKIEERCKLPYLEHKTIYDEFLSIYLGINEYENLICLTEIKINAHSHYDILGDLICTLTSYVIFVNGSIKNHLNSQK